MNTKIGDCINAVSFSGDNVQKVIEHFAKMNPSFDPPFHDVIIDNQTVKFNSHVIPPISELCRVAEKFNVNYDLNFQITNGEAAAHSYISYQNRQLSDIGATFKERISSAKNELELWSLTDELIHDFYYEDKFPADERTVLDHLIGKKFTSISENQLQNNVIHQVQNIESNVSEPNRKIGRS